MSATGQEVTLRTGWDARRVAYFVLDRIGILPIFLVIAVAYFGASEARFLDPDNIRNVSRQATYLSIVTMGQALVLISGGFDLSVGALIAATSVVSATYMSNYYASHPGQEGTALLVGAGAALVVGLIFGLANGIGVAAFKVSPFIMTLGIASIGHGFALNYTGGMPVSGMPKLFTKEIGTGRWYGIHVPVYFTIALIVVMLIVVNWTRLGRYVYAIGGNTRAAYLSGIPVAVYLAAVYLICSLLAAFAGFLLTARVSSGEPNLGLEMPLQSITAAVVGGVSLRGGEGKLVNAILGAIFVTILTNGMNLIRVESYMQQIAIGIILIFAVLVDRLKDRWRV